MNYEINVAKNGKHYFATAERSLRDEAQCLALMSHFHHAFPPEEGFTITASRREHVGYPVAAPWQNEKGE